MPEKSGEGAGAGRPRRGAKGGAATIQEEDPAREDTGASATGITYTVEELQDVVTHP